jgi:hypothetical protein
MCEVLLSCRGVSFDFQVTPVAGFYLARSRDERPRNLLVRLSSTAVSLLYCQVVEFVQGRNLLGIRLDYPVIVTLLVISLPHGGFGTNSYSWSTVSPLQI